MREKFEQIRQIICTGEGIPPEILMAKCRKRELVFARQLIMYFMREIAKVSLHRIGSYLGKDHSTVIHSCIAINNLIETDRDIKMKVILYRERIKMVLEFDYIDSLKTTASIRKNIEFCVDNKDRDPS